MIKRWITVRIKFVMLSNKPGFAFHMVLERRFTCSHYLSTLMRKQRASRISPQFTWGKGFCLSSWSLEFFQSSVKRRKTAAFEALLPAVYYSAVGFSWNLGIAVIRLKGIGSCLSINSANRAVVSKCSFWASV